MSEIRREIERTLAKFVDKALTWDEAVEEFEQKSRVLLLIGIIVGVLIGFIVG